MGCNCGGKKVYKVTTPAGTKETTDQQEAIRLASKFGATITTISR